MKKDPRVYLAQILERIDRIMQFAAGGKDAFLTEKILQDAILYNLEIIGEAANRVSESYRAEHPEIQWRGMAALRNILAHDYDKVDVHRIWLVIEDDLPPLKSAIEHILPPLDKLERELSKDSEK